MTPTTLRDTTALRRLIRARRSAGWEHKVYGDVGHQDHIWRHRRFGSNINSQPKRPARVTYYERELEYFRPGKSMPTDRIRPESIEDVEDFLTKHGLMPEMERV
jgi:hypothetical protein